MSYFTPQDLMFIIMDDQRVVIGDLDDATISNANAQIFVDMAESYVNMRLSKHYTIPLTPAPTSSPTGIQTIEWNYVKNIIANRWAYELYTSIYAANIPNRNDFAEDHRQRCEDMLNKLTEDDPEIELTQQTSSDAGVDTSIGPKVSSEVREFEESITLTGTGYDNHIDLNYEKVKDASERIQNSTRATTYTKGTDYNIDYIRGEVWALAGGTIVSGSSLYITYWRYEENPFSVERNRYETDEYKKAGIISI